MNLLKNQYNEEAESWRMKVESLEKENQRLKELENSSRMMLEESKKAIKELEASHEVSSLFSFSSFKKASYIFFQSRRA